MPAVIFVGGEAGPHWLEMVSWGSQIVLVIVAIATLIYGAAQLREAAASRSQSLKISQATLLLEMDTRWDSEDIKDARALIVAYNEDIGTLVSQNAPLANDAARQALVQQEWSKVLSQLRSSKDHNYGKLIGYCGFFETVGMMVRKGYMSADDVMNLFRGPLLHLDHAFRLHIAEREQETGVPKGLFEHALNLCDLAKNA
jgi:hypothetical protein